MAEKIVEIIKNRFTISAEIIPPRNGTSIQDVFNIIRSLKEVSADFISVTMGAGGSLRGGSLPIAHMVQDKVGLSSLAHFVCRDLIPEEIENHLIDHYYFGIKNILALRGDPPYGLENEYKPRHGSYPFAYNLVEQIANLRDGKYIVRKGYDLEDKDFVSGEKIDFCIGVAAYPEFHDVNTSVDYLKSKVDKGADFAITQMIFDTPSLLRFRDLCVKRGVKIPIIPGFRVLKGPKACDLMEKMFKIKVPDKIRNPLEKKKKGEGTKIGVDLASDLIEEWKKEGFSGVHIFLMEDLEAAKALIKNVK